jgi:hypothetical protein
MGSGLAEIPGMTIRVLVHPRVKDDLAAAAYYYDRRLPGLGKVVIDQMTRLLTRIRHYPLAYPRVRYNVRRAAVAGLDAELLYLHENGQIILLAVVQAKDRHH